MSYSLLVGCVSIIVGASVGAIMHLVLLRLHDQTVLWGRVRCTHCQASVRWHHLLPLIAWLRHRGICEQCGKHMRVQHVWFEMMMSWAFLVTGLRGLFFEFSWERILFEALIVTVLLSLSFFDVRWKELPIELMIAAALVFTIWNIAFGYMSIARMSFGILFLVLFFGLQVLISRGRWLGGGDVWMGMMVGALLGWPHVLVALYLTYLIGGLVMGCLLLFRLVRRTDRIPFAPWIAFGAYGAFVAGAFIESFVRTIWYGSGI